jgi:hypothetical protein
MPPGAKRVAILASVIAAVVAVSCAGSRPPSADGSSAASAKVSDAAPESEPAAAIDIAGAVPIADADRVVAGLRPQFRLCYQTGLAVDRKMEGKVVLTAKVSAEGDVAYVTPGEPSGLSPSVVSCMAGVLKRAQFAAPGGRGSMLAVPVVFKYQPEPKTKKDTFH